MIATIITSIIGGVTTIGGYYIVSNNSLREGITQWLLSKLNKANINKIELKYHKIFILLRNYKSQLNISTFNNEMKGKFCHKYLSIIFDGIRMFLEKLIEEYKNAELITDNKLKKTVLEHAIISCFENAMSDIDDEISRQLIFPAKVMQKFNRWKITQINSLRCDIESVVQDDMLDDSYYKTYEVFSKVSSFANYVVANFSLLFSDINGAFDSLTDTDLFIPKSQEIKAT